MFQVTSALVDIRNHLQQARRGELGGNGVFHYDTLHDVALRSNVHSVLQMENEQGTRFHHVSAVLCIRSGFAHVRIRNHSVPSLEINISYLQYIYYIMEHLIQYYLYEYIINLYIPILK